VSAVAAKRTVLTAVSLLALVAASIAGAGGGSPSGKNRIAPTDPTNFRVKEATQSTVLVKWDPSEDDVRVAGYYVYGDKGRSTVPNPNEVGEEVLIPSYLVKSLGCGQSGTISVEAFDDDRNRSERVPTTVATTPCDDTQPPTTPAGFRQTTTTADSTVLAWDASTDDVGVVGYGVYRGLDRVASPAEPAATLTGLSCGSTFQFGVDALDAAGNRSPIGTAYVQTSSCADTQAPTAPTGLSVTSRTATSVSLSWSPSADNVGVAGYRVSVSGSPKMTVTEPAATISDLACSTTYAIVVDAFDAAGNRSVAASVDAATDACTAPRTTSDTTPPTAPTGLSVSNVTETSLSLSWNPSSDNVGVSGYDIYRNGTKIAATSSTSSSQTGLVCGTSYTFGVVARDAAGNSSAQAEVTSSTPPCAAPPTMSDTSPPSQPSNLMISASTATSVTLAWGASTDNVGVAGYRVYVNGSSGSTTSQVGVTVANLICGMGYTFQVDAYDAAGNRSTKASVTGATAACPDTQAPTQPSNVVTSSRTITSIALSWTPSIDNVGVVGYGLYRGVTLVGTSATTSGIFSGLACGTSYTLAVDAYDGAGNRSLKTAVMVSTTACADTTPPTAPTGLAASSVTQTGLTLTWNASTDDVGVTGYDVYRGSAKTETVAATSSPQSGLACATSYTFGVVARDAAGNSSGQVSLQITTSACSTPPPTGPITITQGGIYTGNWISTSSTPAVTIATTQPVTIVNSTVTNRAGGTLIDAVGGGAVQVTIDHVFAYGGDTYQTSGRLFQAYDFKSVTIRNTTIENTRGIELTYGVTGSSVLITRNRHKNIQGGPNASPVGNFVQLRHVRNATIDISWNEIVNQYNKSNPEDIISIYHSANAKVHDNMLWHQSTPGNPYNQSSQGGITIDCSDAGPTCDNNEIARNQVIDGMGIVTYVTQGGSNNVITENRIVQDGYLDGSTTRVGNGYSGFAILAGGSNNHAHGNVVGYINRDGVRMDWDRLDGAAEGQAAEAQNNSYLPDAVTSAKEQAEMTLWQQKLAANGVSVGA
jgi:chitodextrinase